MSSSEPYSRRHQRPRFTESEKQALIAAVAAGGVKKQIAQDFGIKPQSLSRILRNVKDVDHPSNPLAKDFKATLRHKAVASVTRALDSKRDVYRAGDIGIKVLQGLGDLVQGVQHNVEGNVGFTVRWMSQAEASEPRNVTPALDEETTPT